MLWKTKSKGNCLSRVFCSHSHELAETFKSTKERRFVYRGQKSKNAEVEAATTTHHPVLPPLSRWAILPRQGWAPPGELAMDRWPEVSSLRRWTDCSCLQYPPIFLNWKLWESKHYSNEQDMPRTVWSPPTLACWHMRFPPHWYAPLRPLPILRHQDWALFFFLLAPIILKLIWVRI